MPSIVGIVFWFIFQKMKTFIYFVLHDFISEVLQDNQIHSSELIQYLHSSSLFLVINNTLLVHLNYRDGQLHLVSNTVLPECTFTPYQILQDVCAVMDETAQTLCILLICFCLAFNKKMFEPFMKLNTSTFRSYALRPCIIMVFFCDPLFPHCPSIGVFLRLSTIAFINIFSLITCPNFSKLGRNFYWMKLC